MLTRRSLIATIMLPTLLEVKTNMNSADVGVIGRAIRNLDSRIRDLANRENPSLSKWWVEVRPDNDNLTDQTLELQAAILLASAGGGTVVIGPGVLLAAGVVLHTNVHIQGAGLGATEVKAPSGINTSVFISYNFASLTGTNSMGGITNWSISALVIDGNKDNNLVAGYGLQVYSYDYKLTNLVIRYCRSHGIYSEWSTDAGKPVGSATMSSHFYDVNVHECEGGGADWYGPHDSKWMNCNFVENGGTAIWVRASGNSLQMTHIHVWGLNHDYGAQLDGNAMLENCEIEGAANVQIIIGVPGCSIVGGQQFGVVGLPMRGIQIGRVGVPVGAYRIQTNLFNCESGALDFVDDAGAGAVIDVTIFQTVGVAYIGTPSSGTFRNLRVAGGATGGHMHVPDNGIDLTGLLRVRGSGLAEALLVDDGTSTVFNVNATSKFIDAANGARFRAYSDDRTTLRADINGATGHMLLDRRDATGQTAQFLATGVVNHGMSGLTDVAAYGDLNIADVAAGGLWIDGLTELVRALFLRGAATNGDTARTTGADAPLYMTAGKKSGTGITNLGANENMAVIADNGSVRVGWTSEGYQYFTAALARIIGGATSLALRNAADTANNLLLSDAGIVTLRNHLVLTAGSLLLSAGVVSAIEIADPAAPAANTAYLYARDNGAGKTQWVARFPTGAIQVIATEP